MISCPSSQKKTARQAAGTDIATSISKMEQSNTTTAEKQEKGVIGYSPKQKKSNKENSGFDLTFTPAENLMASIHQLSQTFDEREPLSPSKLKL
jgi:hypothetical protein